MVAIRCGDPNQLMTGLYIKSRFFGSKGEVVHVVKTFSIWLQWQCYVYKSTKTLLKLKCKREIECACCTTKRWWAMGDKKYKGQDTCVNPLINRDHWQPYVLYISTLIMPLVKAELAILVAAVEVEKISILRSRFRLTGRTPSILKHVLCFWNLKPPTNYIREKPSTTSIFMTTLDILVQVSIKKMKTLLQRL